MAAEVTSQAAKVAWDAWTSTPRHDEALSLYPDLLQTVMSEPERIAEAVKAAFLEYAEAVEANPTKDAIFSWSDLARDVREWAEYH